MAEPTITVQPPTRVPRRGGLKSVADFRTEDRLFLGALPVYDALPCSMAVRAVELCYVDSPADPKTAEGIDIGQGLFLTFGGYVGVECFIGPWDDYADRARETLIQSEDRLIEGALGGWIGMSSALPPSADYVTAIAAAEEYADGQYPGRPVIVMNRGAAVIAASQLALFPSDNNDGRLFTANGTPVIASFAVDTDVVLISGGITILQSEIAVSEGYDLTHNTNMAIAERAYSIIVDCDFAGQAPVVAP